MRGSVAGVATLAARLSQLSKPRVLATMSRASGSVNSASRLGLPRPSRAALPDHQPQLLQVLRAGQALVEAREGVGITGVRGDQIAGEACRSDPDRTGVGGFDVVHEPRPALEPVLAGQRELRVGERRIGRLVGLARCGARVPARRRRRSRQARNSSLACFRSCSSDGRAGSRGRRIGHDDLLSMIARVRTTS